MQRVGHKTEWTTEQCVRIGAGVDARAGIANRVRNTEHAQLIMAEVFICRREAALRILGHNRGQCGKEKCKKSGGTECQTSVHDRPLTKASMRRLKASHAKCLNEEYRRVSRRHKAGRLG